MELGDSMPHSQGLSNNYALSEPNQPVPRIDIYFFKIHSNIVLPSYSAYVPARDFTIEITYLLEEYF